MLSHPLSTLNQSQVRTMIITIGLKSESIQQAAFGISYAPRSPGSGPANHSRRILWQAPWLPLCLPRSP